MVPVIRDVDQKGLLQLGGELRELSGKAREGKLMPAQMAGGTFTISSLGGIGGTGFTPIVNAPEVAILGVTRSAIKPVWDGSAFLPRLIVPLSVADPVLVGMSERLEARARRRSLCGASTTVWVLVMS